MWQLHNLSRRARDPFTAVLDGWLVAVGAHLSKKFAFEQNQKALKLNTNRVSGVIRWREGQKLSPLIEANKVLKFHLMLLVDYCLSQYVSAQLGIL